MMAAYALFKCDCLFQWYKLGNARLFGCANYNAASILIGLRLILILLLRYCIDPFECLFSWFLTLQLILHNLSHLRVQKRVSNYHLLLLQIFLEAFSALE